MAIRVPSPSWLWLMATAGLAASGCDSASSSSGTVPPAQTVPQIKTLSNRADMISGGDALVEIVLPPGGSFDKLHVTLQDMPITGTFAKRSDGRITGLVTGLVEGNNLLAADLGDGHGSFLKITNHNIGGPIFSGPQVTPFICATPGGSAGDATTPATNPSGLSGLASTDGKCNIATEAHLFYRRNVSPCTEAVSSATNPDPVSGTPPADACFKPYDRAHPPSDMAMTTTDTGVTMPFIVRVERGTLNRGIYDIAVLFDPSKDDIEAGWKPVAPQAGWNGKVLYSFGASSGHPRLQVHSEQAWADASVSTNAVALGKGFLVAVNSMTDSLFNDNRVLMTETLMMMKEKIIDSYGEVRYVMGNGCSGGSINQVTAASIFPGLLDGIQPTCTFPDSETTAIEVSDCALLVNYYNSQAWRDRLTAESITDQTQINAIKAALNGHLDQGGCHAWVNSFANLGHPGLYVPTVVLNNTTGVTGPGTAAPINNCSLPNSMVYDPASNATGIRCTAQDNAAAIFGLANDGKRAQTTVDNVGIQYGLKAFLTGKISAEDFVTLNEHIGGVDGDDNFTALATGATVPFARSVADPDALATAYRAGIVGDGVHWAQTPIIDLRGWDDQQIHHVWRSFALRARLDAANGNHANYVMWRFPFVLAAPASPDPAIAGLTVKSFLMMDQWLTAMKADTSATTQAARVAAARPVAAFDFCNKPIDASHSTQVTDFAVCDSDPSLVPHSSPRQVAGGPLAENVLKCQLRPINRADYNPVGLSDDQFARLQAVFPDGVCDFTKPGVGQQPAVGP
ncbi:MAG TPA: DUF6351 family protein, partial [Kofleriaceae bacterium]|nr:DUF6351 family protein [Kofleriaceae bacterium]